MTSSFLIIYKGEGCNLKEISLTGKAVTVGNSRKATIYVTSPQLSPRHAMLTFNGHNWKVISFGLKEHVYVNDTKLSKGKSHILLENDLITIGELVNPYFVARFVTSSQSEVGGKEPAPKKRRTCSNEGMRGRSRHCPPFAGEGSSTQFVTPQNSTSVDKRREDRNSSAALNLDSLCDKTESTCRKLMSLQNDLKMIIKGSMSLQNDLEIMLKELVSLQNDLEMTVKGKIHHHSVHM